MEIDENNKKINFKRLSIYYFMIFVFILFHTQTISDFCFLTISCATVNFLIKYINESSITYLLALYFLLYTYFVAKYTGIFKELKYTNFFISIFIISIIGFLCDVANMFDFIIYPKFEIVYPRFEFMKIFYLWIVILDFIIYSIFSLITKNTCFEKIEYYTSIEFVIDTLKRLIKSRKF